MMVADVLGSISSDSYPDVSGDLHIKCKTQGVDITDNQFKEKINGFHTHHGQLDYIYAD